MIEFNIDRHGRMWRILEMMIGTALSVLYIAFVVTAASVITLGLLWLMTGWAGLR